MTVTGESLDRLAGRRVLILGLGREGLSTYAFLRRALPNLPLAIADQQTPEALSPDLRRRLEGDASLRLILGQQYLAALGDYDVVFRTAGISPFRPELRAARQAGVEFTSNTELFLELCPGTTVGVTGTKGKSTTTAMIHHVLAGCGFESRLVGNIGIPPLDGLDGAPKDTVFAIELSSHQLSDVRRSPHIAVLLDIVPEHLDYYESFDQYVSCKANITRFQTPADTLIFNPSHERPAAIARESAARKLAIGFERTGLDGCFVDQGSIVFARGSAAEPVVDVDRIPLRGRHNVENTMPAVIAAKLLGAPSERIAQAISSFKSLEHRLEFACSVDGIDFYDDSLATVPDAAIAAIQALDPKPVVLLAGGFDRGQDYAGLGQVIAGGSVRGLVLLPGTGPRLLEAVQAAARPGGHVPAHVFAGSMDQAVAEAHRLARETGAQSVLLSPAAASFGVFIDYRDRGDQFKRAATALAGAE